MKLPGWLHRQARLALPEFADGYWHAGYRESDAIIAEESGDIGAWFRRAFRIGAALSIGYVERDGDWFRLTDAGRDALSEARAQEGGYA